ncbi:MAG: protein of unknown function, putative Lytic transglycosylase [Nitrospira sp.]|jgi:soluble lytic murein transglycosylase-like protein|nr:protein of unknown function, putative Lytic transglycosylase [Nitrospira sp.]
MRHVESNIRLSHVARAIYPLVVAGFLTVIMPRMDRLALDPTMANPDRFDFAPPVASLIAAHASQYALDPALLHAVIKVESNFNPQAVSPKGALGLMQLMPLTATALDVLDPFDPNDNIRAGAALLRRLLDRFEGDLSLALAAYHAGERRVSRAVGTPLLPGTQLYVERVLRQYDRFLTDAGQSPVRSVTMPRQSQSISDQALHSQ